MFRVYIRISHRVGRLHVLMRNNLRDNLLHKWTSELSSYCVFFSFRGEGGAKSVYTFSLAWVKLTRHGFKINMLQLTLQKEYLCRKQY